VHCLVHDQEDELHLVLARSPGPGESAEAVLLGRQLYFPAQETDVDLLRLLRPYQDVQVPQTLPFGLSISTQCGVMKWALLCCLTRSYRQGTFRTQGALPNQPYQRTSAAMFGAFV
jgi:hypothetical protein